MISDPLVVYRWDDGAYLQMVPAGSWNDDQQANVIVLTFQFVMKGKISARLSQNPSGPLPFMVVGHLLEEDVDKSGPWLRGFLLDSSLRRSTAGFLLATWKGPSVLRVGPSWVPDEQWDTRYDVARKYYVSGSASTRTPSSRRFLGVVPNLNLSVVGRNTMNEEDVRWIGRAGPSPTVVSSWLRFEETVDRMLEKFSVLPERDRAFWESQNALRGTWVNPSEEEISVLQLLGEPNPLLWPADRLYEWYLQRRG